MKKKLLLAAVVVLCLVSLSTVSVSASSTKKMHFSRRMAYAWLIGDDGSQYIITVLEGKGLLLPGESPPFGSWRKGSFLTVMHPSGTRYMKELDPTELKWSFGAVRLSTEVHGQLLTVGWYTEPPTETYHTDVWMPDPEYGSIHMFANGGDRLASVTATLGEYQFEPAPGMVIQVAGYIEIP